MCLFETVDYIESSYKSVFFSRHIFLLACATFFKLPTNISTMDFISSFSIFIYTFMIGILEL